MLHGLAVGAYRALFFFSLLACSQNKSDSEPSQTPSTVAEVARRSLEKNIVEYDGKRYLRAGLKQFSSLWTRDFAYSVPGLLAAGYEQLVWDQISLILSFVRKEDALVPRSLDTINTKRRVVEGMFFPREVSSWASKQTLQAEYEGDHGTHAMDGNVLMVLAIISYARHTNDLSILWSLKKNIEELLSYYESHWSDSNLLRQTKYSDWQDSVKRKGVNFLLNFQYWKALNELSRIEGFLSEDLVGRIAPLREKIERVFYSPQENLYRSTSYSEHVSLEGNLFAILDPNFLSEERKEGLYQSIRQHPLWTKGVIPGIATYPHYPSSWISLQTKSVGLRHYHDEMIWSWLIGLSAMTAKAQGDIKEYDRILAKVQAVLEKDSYVSEIYTPFTLEQHSSQLSFLGMKLSPYKSETPFSWGAAFLYQAARD